MTPNSLRGFLPADTRPATTELLADLARGAADYAGHEHPTPHDGEGEDLYCLNLTSYLGERVAPVLALVADLQDRLAQIAENITPCPPPAPGTDSCRHGAWPCPLTVAAWLARDLNPAAEAAKGPDPAARAAPVRPSIPTGYPVRFDDGNTLFLREPAPERPAPTAVARPEILLGDLWRDDHLGGALWRAHLDEDGRLELREPGGPGRVPARDVPQISGTGFTLVERITPDSAGCPICGAPTPSNRPCVSRPAGSPAGTPSCADLADDTETTVLPDEGQQ